MKREYVSITPEALVWLLRRFAICAVPDDARYVRAEDAGHMLRVYIESDGFMDLAEGECASEHSLLGTWAIELYDKHHGAKG